MITAAPTTSTRSASVLLPGFFNLKSTTNNSPTINSARCSQIRKTKSGTKNWIMNTNGNTIAMDVIGNPL